MRERNMADVALGGDPSPRRRTGWVETVAPDAAFPSETETTPAGQPVSPLPLDPSDTDDPWKAAFGLESGTTILPGGRIREVDVAGEQLEILEYDAKGRTAIQHGRIDEVSVSMETARYETDGRPITRLTAELHAVEGFSPAMSAAALHRDGQWFEDGLVIRDAREGLRLFVVRGAGLDVAADSGPPLGDSLHARHCANIREYRAEEQILDATVDQAWDAVLTPRSDLGESREGTGHRFSLTVNHLDAVGRPVRGLCLTDAWDAAGSRCLELSVTRYESGAVAGVVAGTWRVPAGLSLPPVEAAWRRALPGGKILAAGPDGPEAAGVILSSIFLEASRDPGDLLAPARQALAGRARELAALAGESLHAVSWLREEYAEGVLVGRRLDTGHVRQAGSDEGGPALLAGASHVDERFWDGEAVSRHGLELEELVGEDGPVTTCRATAGVGEQPRLATRVTSGGLAEADPEADRARLAMVREAGAVLTEVVALLSRLG